MSHGLMEMCLFLFFIPKSVLKYLTSLFIIVFYLLALFIQHYVMVINYLYRQYRLDTMCELGHYDLKVEANISGLECNSNARVRECKCIVKAFLLCTLKRKKLFTIIKMKLFKNVLKSCKLLVYFFFLHSLFICIFTIKDLKTKQSVACFYML